MLNKYHIFQATELQFTHISSSILTVPSRTIHFLLKLNAHISLISVRLKVIHLATKPILFWAACHSASWMICTCTTASAQLPALYWKLTWDKTQDLQWRQNFRDLKSRQFTPALNSAQQKTFLTWVLVIKRSSIHLVLKARLWCDRRRTPIWQRSPYCWGRVSRCRPVHAVELNWVTWVRKGNVLPREEWSLFFFSPFFFFNSYIQDSKAWKDFRSLKAICILGAFSQFSYQMTNTGCLNSNIIILPTACT